MNHPSRRTFLAASASAAAALSLRAPALAADPPQPAAAGTEPFKISLAEWSFNKALFGNRLDHLDFPNVAKQEFGIDAVEYVNQFFKNKAKDQRYLAEMKKRCDDLGVRSVLIMCDDEGWLGDPSEKKRKTAVENHYKWADAASFLGCHAIRVNAASEGSWDDQLGRAADGLRQLAEYGAKLGLNVIVENHGGLSSNGEWLAAVMKAVNLPNCGTLPDFGNFQIKRGEEYDRYKGVDLLMPYAKGVSAKSHDFDRNGNETHTDYFKMMDIVVNKHGYHNHVGIEYEGAKLPEREGVRATLNLLNKVREQMKNKTTKG
jgi:sugar phosphate isomerase/epimerase